MENEKVPVGEDDEAVGVYGRKTVLSQEDDPKKE